MSQCQFLFISFIQFLCELKYNHEERVLMQHDREDNFVYRAKKLLNFYLVTFVINGMTKMTKIINMSIN